MTIIRFPLAVQEKIIPFLDPAQIEVKMEVKITAPVPPDLLEYLATLHSEGVTFLSPVK